MQEEVWIELPESDGLYFVSNLGRIKRVYKKTGDRILKNCLSNNGYFVVNVKINGKRMVKTVHRLIASAFLGLRLEDTKTEINHKNSNKLDNRVDNLEKVSHRENAIHFYSFNKKKSSVGVKFRSDCKKWEANITLTKNGRRKIYYLGSFNSEEEASRVYEIYKFNIENGGNLVEYIDYRNDHKYRFSGVYWSVKAKKWIAQHKGNYIGIYESDDEARMARQEWLINRGIPIYS